MPIPVGRGTVVAFTGTITDAPARPVRRFPDDPELVTSVKAELRAALIELGADEGVSSAARGADLLFLEVLLELGGRATVLLPFAAEAFEKTSVGHGWNGRFRTTLADPRVQVRILAPAAPADADLPAAFEACNTAITTLARERATQRGCATRLLAVWDGRPGDGRGGSADFVRAWQEGGGEAKVIQLPPARPS